MRLRVNTSPPKGGSQWFTNSCSGYWLSFTWLDQKHYSSLQHVFQLQFQKQQFICHFMVHHTWSFSLSPKSSVGWYCVMLCKLKENWDLVKVLWPQNARFQTQSLSQEVCIKDSNQNCMKVWPFHKYDFRLKATMHKYVLKGIKARSAKTQLLLNQCVRISKP